MEVKLSNSHLHKQLNVDVERTLTVKIDFVHESKGSYWGNKRMRMTAMKTVKMGMAKMQLCYIFIAVNCCGVISVSTSAFIYFQCNGDQKFIYILL